MENSANRFVYTAKNAEPAAQQDWTMFCCPRCSHLSTILNNIVEPASGVTILFNIIDNCEQCGPQSIAQSCFHQYCNNLIVFLPYSNKNLLDCNRNETGSHFVFVRKWLVQGYPELNSQSNYGKALSASRVYATTIQNNKKYAKVYDKFINTVSRVIVVVTSIKRTTL
jgi:hypothetical protein